MTMLGSSISLMLHLLMMPESSFTIIKCLWYKQLIYPNWLKELTLNGNSENNFEQNKEKNEMLSHHLLFIKQSKGISR
jgi:hypothetical protein